VANDCRFFWDTVHSIRPSFICKSAKRLTPRTSVRWISGKVKNPRYEIAQIIQRFLPEVIAKHPLSGHQKSILNLMSLCKTAALGGHKEQCEQCLYTRIHYNSCGNRNCPSCQAVNKEKWIHDRLYDLLPVKYFHCVFTIPCELYPYFRYNKKQLYDLLFQCVRETQLTFGLDPKHAISGKVGAICLLHTWTQQMTYRPHVHCIVPAGGLDKNGTWRHAKSNGDFLFPVKAMSRLFRGKLLAELHLLHKQAALAMTPTMSKLHYQTKNKLYNKEWVVYAKKAFGGPKQVLEYLGRYSHRICISNFRITNISQTHVTFKYQDRKNKKQKSKSIKGTSFIRLFCEHILPKRFVKIRHIGILASRVKKTDLYLARKSLGAPSPPPKIKLNTRDFITTTAGKDPYLCPCCGKGEMVIIAVIPPIRGSPIRPPIRFIPSYRKINITI